MKVFTTSTVNQNLVFIGRRDATDIIVNIKDESNDNTYNQVLTATNSNGYTTTIIEWDGFIEGRTYEIEINEAFVIAQDPLLWRGKADCTDQTDIQNVKLIPEVRDNIIEI